MQLCKGPRWTDLLGIIGGELINYRELYSLLYYTLGLQAKSNYKCRDLNFVFGRE